jgi:hypothetical protein
MQEKISNRFLMKQFEELKNKKNSVKYIKNENKNFFSNFFIC